MPLMRISMRRGRPASEPAAIVDGVYKALRATFEVPENDLFAVVHQHDAEEFVFDANYFGFERTGRAGDHPALRRQHPRRHPEEGALRGDRREPPDASRA